MHDRLINVIFRTRILFSATGEGVCVGGDIVLALLPYAPSDFANYPHFLSLEISVAPQLQAIFESIWYESEAEQDRDTHAEGRGG